MDNERAYIRRLLIRWGNATRTCRAKQREIAEYNTLIESVYDLKPPKLSDMPKAQGRSDPTALTVEQATQLKERYNDRIKELINDISSELAFVSFIDSALDEFPTLEKNVIELRYKRFAETRQDPWVKTARLMDKSVDWAKALERSAIDRLMDYIDVEVN